MNSTSGLEKCIIEGVLETKKDARNIGFELVRLGRKIKGSNVINEVIYEKEKRKKDEENLPAYRNNEILINNKREKTLDLFVEHYGKEKKKCFKDINSILITSIFGKEFIDIFNYSQRKLNQTKKQRIGGEKLKDSYIFVHSFRTAEILKEFGASNYQIRLGFLHDVIEELRDWRIKKIKNNSVKDIEEIKKLKDYIKSPPEYKEIHNLLVKTNKKNGKEKISEEETRLINYHLRLLTRHVNESYKNYAKRMHHNCFKNKAKNNVEYLTSDKKEQMNFYVTPLAVKLADSIDNTRTARHGGLPKRIKRLYHNVYTLNELDNFLYHSKSGILIKLRKELIKDSIEEIERNINDFGDGKDPTVTAKYELFQDLKRQYIKLDKKNLNNLVIQKDKNI